MSDGAPRARSTGMSGVSRAVKIRAYVATVLLTLLLIGVGYKAWALQVENAAQFRASALRQHVHTVEIPAPRGAILDTRGRPLAVSADAESVYANPREVVDVVGTAEKLQQLLDVDAARLEARMASDKAFAWIERQVTPEEAAAVRAAALPGIEVTTEPRRWYPGQSSGGPLLGFAGIDGNGLDGIELRFDKQLTGTRARFAALRDARGKTALAEGVVEAVPGATVQLTIDQAIQSIADRALAEAVTLHKAKSGVVVVLEVGTGRVLAMASYPTYDPNDPGDAVKRKARNRAVTDVYEIGSVMKVFTVAAALDAKVVRPEDWFNVEHGSWKWRDNLKPIRDTHRDDALSVGGILKRSSNIGVVKIALRLGRERLYTALRGFGFGARTGIELPLEEPGTLRDGKRWREVELATISYGYGLTVTPLQVAAAFAAIGDQGRWYTPHLVEKITDAEGKLVYEPVVEMRQIMKGRTATQLRPMLRSVFDKGHKGKNAGTAKDVLIEGYLAGGKTGTAHKIDPVTKKYAKTLYLSSFAGLAPIAKPRIAVVVVIDEPTGGDYYGGKVAGPVFAAVTSETLRYLGVEEDGPREEEETETEKESGSGSGTGSGTGTGTEPDAEEIDVIELEALDETAIDVPDFRGMGIKRAIAAAGEAGIPIDVVGSGRAVRQDPAPGKAPAGSGVRVTFVADGIGNQLDSQQNQP